MPAPRKRLASRSAPPGLAVNRMPSWSCQLLEQVALVLAAAASCLAATGHSSQSTVTSPATTVLSCFVSMVPLIDEETGVRMAEIVPLTRYHPETRGAGQMWPAPREIACHPNRLLTSAAGWCLMNPAVVLRLGGDVHGAPGLPRLRPGGSSKSCESQGDDMSEGAVATAQSRRAGIGCLLGMGLLLGVMMFPGCDTQTSKTPVTKQAGTTATTQATTSTTTHPPTTTTTSPTTT